MHFRIADTFTDSLTKLTGDEQKAVKTTAFDLQLNPANPGLKFHKLNAARDPGFWSVRAGRDIRVIVHRSADSVLLCYAAHHDRAYRWGETRKLDVHPKTGVAQLVEIRETVETITVPKYVEDESLPGPKPALFADMAPDDLLKYGVPEEWVDDVLSADEDSLLVLADHLPSEAAEALLELATGGQPELPQKQAADADPFEHPDAQRRFRILTDADELARALDYPWEKWTVFLHPAQRRVVERKYNGPARVSGSAGTGKTIVALHRAVHLARAHPNAHILLTTFSETLAHALQTKLRRLLGNEPRFGERLEVHSLDVIGDRLYEGQFGPVKVAPRDEIQRNLIQASADKGAGKFSVRFLIGEWEDVVDAWQLDTWESYRDVRRLGRKTRLSEQQRAALWAVFDEVRQGLSERGFITRSQLFSRLATQIAERRHPPFDFAVVDEAQDIGVAQLRFLAALGGDRPNCLFFAGDLGQRIFQTPFSWKSLGVDVRGRSQTLRINYRTSHQIRQQADRLLGQEVADVDGNVESRRGTVSVFNGPRPQIETFESAELEAEAVGEWLTALQSEPVLPHEIGLFVRSAAQLPRAESSATQAGLAFKVLDEHAETTHGHCSISTMHLAKGLEFRAVAVMACDDEVLPSQERIENVSDDADLEEVYDTERQLLYVACTRARDRLLVTGVSPESEFLDDLLG
ncbi:MAG: AAA family ATPase [Gammaproteobacteria bacterium]|nr:AAA family ATPase [Gammaproteobacteria bacterium]